ncbi:MAG: FIST N-terminal domain-containing protein [Candidatus Micrarchaeia archaeon]|jgi:hypothetical protein
MKLVSDIMRLSGRDLRDSVLSILTDEWPLSAREIYKRVSKDYKINVTYQGVHKAVRQMADEGLLVPREGKYSINLQWVNQLVSFGKKVEGAYKSNAAAPALEVGAGSSTDNDAFEAGKEAARKALKCLNFNSKHQLVLVFCSSSYDGHYAELLKGIRSVTGSTPLAGCTTLGGEIFNSPLSKSVVVSIFSSDTDAFTATTHAIPIPAEAYKGKTKELEKRIVHGVSVHPDEKGFGIVLFPGYTIASGMQTAALFAMPILSRLFGKNFPLIGGLAGDDWKFNSTALFKDGEVIETSMILVKATTSLPFELSNESAYFNKKTPKYVLTFNKKGYVVRITPKAGGKPLDAITGYSTAAGVSESTVRKYLPQFIKDTVSMNLLPPLLSQEGKRLNYLLSVEGNNLNIQPGFKTGDVVQIGHTSPQKMVELVGSMARQMVSHITKPACILLLPCGFFEAVISRAGLDEVAAAKARLPKNAPVVGFYCAGEIGGKAFPLGNGTASMLVIGSERYD